MGILFLANRAVDTNLDTNKLWEDSFSCVGAGPARKTAQGLPGSRDQAHISLHPVAACLGRHCSGRQWKGQGTGSKFRPVRSTTGDSNSGDSSLHPVHLGLRIMVYCLVEMGEGRTPSENSFSYSPDRNLVQRPLALEPDERSLHGLALHRQSSAPHH